MTQYLVSVGTTLDDLPIALLQDKAIAIALADDIEAVEMSDGEQEHYAKSASRALLGLDRASYFFTRVIEFDASDGRPLAVVYQTPGV